MLQTYEYLRKSGKVRGPISEFHAFQRLFHHETKFRYLEHVVGIAQHAIESMRKSAAVSTRAFVTGVEFIRHQQTALIVDTTMTCTQRSSYTD